MQQESVEKKNNKAPPHTKRSGFGPYFVRETPEVPAGKDLKLTRG